MKIKAFFQTILIMALFSFNAFALEITFGDTTTHWAGWGGGYCTWNYSITDNARDTIGTPNILGGTATVNGSSLNALTINYYNSAYYGAITPGDLFIDLASDGDWDYVIDTSTRNIYHFADGTFLLGSMTGYFLSGDIDRHTDSINYTGITTWTAPYSGTWDIRDDHPVLYSGRLASTLVGQATVTPTVFASTTGYKYITYSGLDLDLTSEYFTLGWTIDCANDVLYEKVKAPAPVPEPATLLLVGTGLMGLAGFRRKRS